MTTAVDSSTASSAAAAAQAALGSTSSANSASDIQNRFLQLLITQMQNQDPLNPLDNSEVTSQLAQISTVNGISQLNTTMQSLLTSSSAAQSAQTSSLIGHTVLSDGNSFQLASGGSALGAVNLSQAADSVNISIVGPSGNVVRQMALGKQPAGLAGFKWDGLTDNGSTAAAGTYTFKVTATSGGQSVSTTSNVAGTVSGITIATDGLHLTVDGVGDVPMTQVTSIL